MGKAAVAAVAAALLGLLLQKTEPSQSLLLGLCAAGLIVGLGASLLRELGDYFEALLSEAGLSAALTVPVVKSLGVAVVGHLSAELCRDAGQSAPAAALELSAAVIALYTALPLIKTVTALLRTAA